MCGVSCEKNWNAISACFVSVPQTGTAASESSFLDVKQAAQLAERQTDRWFLNSACCLESWEVTKKNLGSGLVKLCVSSSHAQIKK